MRILSFLLWPIFLLFVFVISVFPIQITKEDSLEYLAPFEVSVYEDAMLSDFVQVKNGTLEDVAIDTSSLGIQPISFSYRDQQGVRKKRTIGIQVVDHTPPLIWLSNSYTVVKGTTSFIEDILCGDNYDKEPHCYIEGEYNLNEVGNYPLLYVAEDKSGNVAKQEFILNVIEKKGGSSSSSKTTTSFQEILKKHQSEQVMVGIDVSKWQGEIDFAELKKAGCEFIMIRLGSQGGVLKDSTIDPYFEANLKQAKELGFQVGVYYYSYASSMEEARLQAEWVLSQLNGEKLDLPIVFDWECWSHFRTMKISFHDLNEISNAFLDTIQQAGYETMHYSSKNYLEKIWTTIDHDVWLAHYTKATNYQGAYRMWQLCNNGRIAGIDGDVDIDLLYLQEGE